MAKWKGFSEVDMRWAKNISHKEAARVLKWTEKYLDIFSDNLVESIFIKVRKTRFLGKADYHTIYKRMINIPIKFLENLDLYFEYFTTPVAYLFFLERSIRRDLCHFNERDRDAVGSMLAFVRKWGYLSERQIKYVKILFEKSHSSVSTKMVVAEFKSEAKDLLSARILTFREKKKNFNVETFVEEMEEEKKEELGKKFFTLDEIRKKMSV